MDSDFSTGFLSVVVEPVMFFGVADSSSSDSSSSESSSSDSSPSDSSSSVSSSHATSSSLFDVAPVTC